MRISNQSVNGRFWLPLEPDKDISGKLIIYDGGIIELEVMEAIGTNEEAIKAIFEDEFIDIIKGYLETSEFVILEICFYKKTKLPFTTIGSSVLHVNRAIIGSHDIDKLPPLTSITFSVEGIDEWIGISGIKYSLDSSNFNVEIKYEWPEAIKYKIEDNYTLSFIFNSIIPSPTI